MFVAVAARGLAHVFDLYIRCLRAEADTSKSAVMRAHNRGVINKLPFLFSVLLLLLSAFTACFSLYISHLNYPGGESLHKLHEITADFIDSPVMLEKNGACVCSCLVLVFIRLLFV